MANSFFQFKQFTVWHDRCAMKVGTDGVLLGAWAPACSGRILDVGTGTGLIALQLAQRNPHARITGVEMDAEAAGQAVENVARSPWNDRIEVVCRDFREFRTEEKFDLIVSNPPYFADALKCPDEQRCMARHAGALDYEWLFGRSAQLLSEQGQLSIIIPSEVEHAVSATARKHGFRLRQCMRVFTKPGKPARRVMAVWGFQEGECREEQLYIESECGQFTTEYTALTRDFYLKM